VAVTLLQIVYLLNNLTHQRTALINENNIKDAIIYNNDMQTFIHILLKQLKPSYGEHLFYGLKSCHRADALKIQNH